MIHTLFAESTAWHDKGMVEGNQSALAWSALRPLRTERRVVRIPDELRPVAMDCLRERLDERIDDVTEERRRRGEVGDRDSLEFQAFSTEVGVDKADEFAFRRARVSNRLERSQDLLRRLRSWLVNEGFGV